MLFAYALVIGVVSLAMSLIAAAITVRKPEGNKDMKRVAEAIREGSRAYLHRQGKVIAAFAIVLAILFLVLKDGWLIDVAFLTGAFTSYLTAYLGMSVAVRANSRTANIAERGVEKAFYTAIIGGTVTGFAAVGLGLIGLVLLLNYFTLTPHTIPLIIGFGFGASLVSLFARVGGGIYTKSADVGADLVGKTELNLPEDDPRNPATIADNVGDNVGDCAGMSADVYESYVVTLVAALLIAVPFAIKAPNLVEYPILLASMGIIASLLGLAFIKPRSNKVERVLYSGIGSAVLIAAILDFAITYLLRIGMYYFLAVLSGLLLVILLFAITDYYTGRRAKYVIKVASAAQGGGGTDVIMGLAAGLHSTFWPVLAVVVAILVSFESARVYGTVYGVYGIGIAAVSMLSLTATVLTIDSFGPITDNAGGIAEMSHAKEHVRNVTDRLDAMGNTTKATTKGFAIGGAALSATALFVAFAQAASISTIDALNPIVTAGIFIGALLPFIFSSFLMEAVGKGADALVDEVRRQFKTIKGLMQGKAKPDYAKVVDMTTVNALKNLVLPELFAVLTPILVGLLLGKEALAGLLVGMIPASFVLALFMANSGATMDNAKKYVEAGNFGGKGSDTHKAAVVGDTVGDPLKDTAGPALNSMIKVISTISILLAGIFVYALI